MAIGVRKSESAAKPECLSHANYYVINSSDMCYAVNYYAGGFQKKITTPVYLLLLITVAI
jgi:hypothetical protein